MRTSGLKNLLSKFEDDEESPVEKNDSSNSQQISMNEEEADNFETKNDEPAKKKFKCDYCEKEFDRKFNLQRHNESRNLQECSICRLVLCNPYDLKRHIANAHK